MHIFERLQTLFIDDLDELADLQQHWWFKLSTTRILREEHLGRCCYLAEELLGSDDLHILKNSVGLNEQRWRTYKARISGQ